MKIKNFQKKSVNRDIKLEVLRLLPKRKKAIEDRRDAMNVRYLGRKRGGSNSSWILLPKYVAITPKLTRALGIYYAEGNKSKTRRDSSFSNSEPKLIKEGLNLFKSLGLKKVKGHIKIYNQRISDKELVNYWSDISGIPAKNFIKISKALSRKEYKRKRRFPPKYGLLEIYFSSVIIRDVIDNLLEVVKNLTLENQKIRRSFLKGLIAGDGSVKLVNNNLRELRIASCDMEEQNFIRILLEKEDIRLPNYRCKFYVGFSGLDNFIKVNQSKIFDLHPKKRATFNFGLQNLRLSH